jgi:hypothetical protein
MCSMGEKWVPPMKTGPMTTQCVHKGPNDRRLGLKHHLHHHLDMSQHEHHHLGASKHDHSTQRSQKVRRVSGTRTVVCFFVFCFYYYYTNLIFLKLLTLTR